MLFSETFDENEHKPQCARTLPKERRPTQIELLKKSEYFWSDAKR